jgi:hypothetical protein
MAETMIVAQISFFRRSAVGMISRRGAEAQRNDKKSQETGDSQEPGDEFFYLLLAPSF